MNFLEEVLSFIFTNECEICGKVSEKYICNKCKEKIEKSKIFLNKIDDYKNDKTKYFGEHAYIFLYDEPIRKKILEYKFYNKPYLSKMFSEFLIKNEKLCRFFEKYDIIIPVPMTKKKMWKRGYNQSELIARILTKKYKKLYLDKYSLIKYKENKTQSTLNKTERIENVKNVYRVQSKEIIKQKNILLIDDIYTTGATCNECSKILKQNGCKQIGIFTIAKDFKT